MPVSTYRVAAARPCRRQELPVLAAACMLPAISVRMPRTCVPRFLILLVHTCRHAPYLVEFQERAHVFATLVATEKRARAEDDWAAGRRFSGPAVATIRRDQLLTDGFAQLNLVSSRSWHRRRSANR